ncbi:MAG TPA: hypothetical protein VM845_07535 [Burkholderiaceae bacterium]|jgi:hypothetical protein|nr:hypothetical protein [Burkholderiaceae bacterium]
MNTSWTIRAWPPLLWQADGAAHLHFNHVETQVFPASDEEAPVSGQTVWRTTAPDGEAGVAWDWVMLSRDVIAMADPMCVVTNLRLLGDKGEVLTSWEAARHLSRIVYGLPWQGEVQRAVGRELND